MSTDQTQLEEVMIVAVGNLVIPVSIRLVHGPRASRIRALNVFSVVLLAWNIMRKQVGQYRIA